MTRKSTHMGCAATSAARPRPVLSRALIAAGGAGALAAADDPAIRLTSEAERSASLRLFLRDRPSGDLWVFAYGSLIWNPALRIAEERRARIDDWHRAFCLSMPVGRGTADRPGLALGLDRGGGCEGMAYRIADTDLETELPILWNREMLIAGYIPQWLEVKNAEGIAFGWAIAFVIDRDAPHYVDNLPTGTQVMRLATAAGSWGTSADYLFRTDDALRSHGIVDRNLARLAFQVSGAIGESRALALAA
ncbi:MAG: gamma-glutamylcyclotransferase [Sphingomonas sp.]|uniref:gamma-glutamylcyclotransferase n=1 Tax=Sphingomonas sp. TaxID=28214 RepID=UPI0025EA1922|nr:gamma-glutamylcyclotransferase [Sphingomonas sp.]MBQ1497023.1 gamma-glutamylcyclotransferase [Sphingomonas sp.]